jgi:hypothetical protein
MRGCQHPERAREAIDRLVARLDADRRMQQQQRTAASALDELDTRSRDVREVVGKVAAVKHGEERSAAPRGFKPNRCTQRR